MRRIREGEKERWGEARNIETKVGRASARADDSAGGGSAEALQCGDQLQEDASWGALNSARDEPCPTVCCGVGSGRASPRRCKGSDAGTRFFSKPLLGGDRTDGVGAGADAAALQP